MNEKILVVDDEKEIADLLEVYLKNDNYIVHKYYNGIEALECIQKTEIDLAILDVMLPDIDGFRICQKIRENYYFPVIMLTAKIDDGDKIMGLTIGADDYITKPFHTSLLISRCNNLVNSRRILQEKFSKQPQAPARILATNPMDEDLLERTMEIIERNMDNSEFSLSELIRELCMSRTYFFQKIKGITGQTPNEFLSTVRLKRAAFLLRSDLTLSISEISDKTGFSSPRYFGRCFKEAYGVSPLGYRNKGKEDEEQVEKDEE